MYKSNKVLHKHQFFSLGCDNYLVDLASGKNSGS